MENSILEAAKATYGSPIYVFDQAAAKDRIVRVKDSLGGKYGVCYAMKANPFIAKGMAKVADRLEVCSPGEYEICIRGGVAPEKIIVSGVNKTHETMTRIVSVSGGKGIYTIESMQHAQILMQVAKEQGVKLLVQIRLTSGNQFGVDEEMFHEIAGMISKSEELSLTGIHYYSGTQKKLKKVEKELAMLDEFAAQIKEEFGVGELELEYGPGLCVSYFVGEADTSDEEQLAQLKELLDGLKEYKHITVEMGRFLASYCGYYLSTVVDLKNNKDHNYVILDGGIHQLNYYGQMMGMHHPYTEILGKGEAVSAQEGHAYNLCGSLCTVNDVITRDIHYSSLEKDDTIVFKRCGAYSVTEGMAMFLSRDLPKVAIYDEGKLTLVRDRIETNGFNAG